MVAERNDDRAESRRAFIERCGKSALVPPTVGLVLAAGEKPALAKTSYQSASRDAKLAAREARRADKAAAKEARQAAKEAAKDASADAGKAKD